MEPTSKKTGYQSHNIGMTSNHIMSSVNENGLKKLKEPMSSVKKEDLNDEDLQFDEDIHPESIAR